MKKEYVKIDSSPQTMPNIQFVELMIAVLSKRKPFRFQASGFSMSPFIQDGDTITVSPLPDKLQFGEVIAVFDVNKHLYIHRIIRIFRDKYLIKGDNSEELDGWVKKNDILGVVTSIEHQTRLMKIGLGIERTFIAYLSQLGWLKPLMSFLLRARTLFFKRPSQ